MQEKPQLQALYAEPTLPFTAAGSDVRTNKWNDKQKAITFVQALSDKRPTEVVTILIFQNRLFKP